MITGSGKRRPFRVRRSSIRSKAVHSVPFTIRSPTVRLESFRIPFGPLCYAVN
jgi:hypothetical protein